MRGIVIENSLRDPSVLRDLQIVRTWKDEDWVLHEVRVSCEQIEKFMKHLDDGPWYVHFWEEGSDDVLVVFRNKIFNIKFSDKSTWKEAIEHGKSIGIPEEQLDFVVN